jgi:hypothetical protein
MYMSKLRILKAVLGTTVFVSIMSFLLGMNMTIAHSPAGLNGGLMVATAATIIGFIAILFLAVPVHYFLNYKGLKLMRWYALAGIAPGIILIFIGNFFGKDPFLTQLLQTVPLAIFGAICACVFCYLANEKNT